MPSTRLKPTENAPVVVSAKRVASVRLKATPDATPEQMGDAHDARSRIVTARWNGKLVGSIRVTFPRSEADRLRHEDYCELPRTLPPRTELVEMSKACTHPEFRGSDLFYSIVKHAAVVTIQSRRRYILMSCTDQLFPIYRKLGLRDLGISYVHASMGLRHRVMLGDVASMAAGGMNPVVWNLAIGPEVWAFANLCGAVPRSPWRDACVKLLPLFKPLMFLARLQARRLRARRVRR